MMKKLILMIAFLVANGAFAEETMAPNTFNFVYWGQHAGSYTMVSCDYAERQAEELFRLFGVTNALVSCSGGIEPSGYFSPLTLSVSYTPVKLGENTRIVREHFRSEAFDHACDFNSRLVRQAVREVKNVKIVSANDSCLGGFQDFSFAFAVKLPQ